MPHSGRHVGFRGIDSRTSPTAASADLFQRYQNQNRKPVFVIVTARDCGACIGYKANYLDALKQRLERISDRVRTVHIDLNSMQGPLPEPLRDQDDPTSQPQGYSHDLLRYLGWFPTFLLFTGYSWDHQDKVPLEGLVFNGARKPDGTIEFAPSPEMGNPTPEKLVTWVQRELDNNRIFKPRDKIVKGVFPFVPGLSNPGISPRLQRSSHQPEMARPMTRSEERRINYGARSLSDPRDQYGYY